MKQTTSWLIAAVLVSWGAGAARGQFVNPYYNQNPYLAVGAGVPYAPYPYAYPYVYAPGSGNLFGSASVINAGTGYMLGVQQAKLGQQAVKRAKLENKRAAFDEWKYEQANTPTPEDLRERDQAIQLRRMRNDPAVTDVWSGTALNVLLRDLQRLHAGQTSISTGMLNPDVLKRINVTGSRNDVSLGLLRDDGKLQWPFALRAPEFNDDREAIEQEMVKAVRQAKSGGVAFDTVNALGQSVERLLNRLRQQVRDMPSNQWTEAKRYVDQLQAAVRTLQDPAVANYFNGKWSAQGNTVEELVKYMTTQGLRFAPATQGDETAYQVLYQDLLAYDTALGQRLGRAEMTAMSSPPPQPTQRRR